MSTKAATKRRSSKKAIEQSAAPKLNSADTFGKFAHPRTVTSVLGHDDAIATFTAAVHDERLHHAWLISGEHGIGKATLAYRLTEILFNASSAKQVANENNAIGQGDHTTFDDDNPNQDEILIRQGTHPHVKTLTRTHQGSRLSSEIRVDDLRSLQQFFSIKCDPGRWRVCIIDSANELNRNAANALLKQLEEPQPGCVFLLIAHRAGALPPTIRSRCRLLPLKPLSDDNLLEVLRRRRCDLNISSATEENSSDADAEVPSWLREICKNHNLHRYPEDHPYLLSLAGGSVRKSLSITHHGGALLASVINGIIRGKVTDVEQFKLAKHLSQPDNDLLYQTFGEMMVTALSREVYSAALAKNEASPSENADTVKRVLAIIERVREVLDDEIALRLDRVQVIWRVMDSITSPR